jgi:hypothetical protein
MERRNRLGQQPIQIKQRVDHNSDWEQRDADRGQEQLPPMPRDHIIDDELRRAGSTMNHHRAENRARQRPGRHSPVPLQMSKNSPDHFHVLDFFQS